MPDATAVTSIALKTRTTDKRNIRLANVCDCEILGALMESVMRSPKSLIKFTTSLLVIALSASAQAASCSKSAAAEKQLLWGDLHAHTANSLDAWAFGAIATPKDAYAFAKGQSLRLSNGDMKTIDRPLDFAAVTDHAETWDQMYRCTDPEYVDHPYCNGMRDLHEKKDARQIFTKYLLPAVTTETPTPAGVCIGDEKRCTQARVNQWRRTQIAANQANEPCEFTALIGYEWTGSPGGRHWHRNVIFSGDKVPDQAYDFTRFPKVQQLWQKLSDNCDEEQGCRVLTIPHNINWADGGRTFAVEDETEAEWAVRNRFERLAEIYQEKGSSECLPQNKEDLDGDCSFDLVQENAAKTMISGPEKSTPKEAWTRARSSYYRSLLGRGLAAYQLGRSRGNPLMLGAIGSTDTHFGTPGRVAEESYTRGIAGLLMTDEQQLGRTSFNSGGLVAVWADENTRTGVFDALHRREAYATSGPRISLRFGVGESNYCEQPSPSLHVTMGGSLDKSANGHAQSPWFAIQAMKDAAKLEHIQIIKGEYRDEQIQETVVEVARYDKGRSNACLTWQDEDFDPAVPAYWYARVLEVPTPRWSKLLCEKAELCTQFPDADKLAAERAWSSPIWHLPE